LKLKLVPLPKLIGVPIPNLVPKETYKDTSIRKKNDIVENLCLQDVSPNVAVSLVEKFNKKNPTTD
jgi:hypothetical protein